MMPPLGSQTVTSALPIEARHSTDSPSETHVNAVMSRQNHSHTATAGVDVGAHSKIPKRFKK